MSLDHRKWPMPRTPLEVLASSESNGCPWKKGPVGLQGMEQDMEQGMQADGNTVSNQSVGSCELTSFSLAPRKHLSFGHQGQHMMSPTRNI